MATRSRRDLPGPQLGCHIFISYASEDRKTVLRLRKELQEAGARSVWVDRPEIDPGNEWMREIRHALRRAQCVLAAVTERSVDPNRRYIVYEQEEALRLFRPIIPCLLDVGVDETCLPERLKKLQFADFRTDWRDGFLRVLHVLGKITLRPGEQLSNQTPPLLQVFVGREAEIREVVHLLHKEAREVDTARKSIAIQAMGGMGKSMLAAEVVRRIGPRYDGGVLYVDRGKGRENVQLVLQRWVELADGRYPEREVTPGEVRDRLRTFGELLVLVDDVGEGDFEQTRTLLDALPPDATRLLTTRSTRIQRDLGAQIYGLGRLDEEDALALLANRLARLERAPDEGPLRKIVRKVEGHPLSLELIAGRFDQSSDAAGLLEELDEILESGDLGLEALELEAEEDPDKYRSLAANLQLSFGRLLAIDGKRGGELAPRFLDLGVCPGGGLIDKPMAMAVWGDYPDDRRALRQANRTLAVYVRRAMLALDPETELYRLHPLMRAFAFHRLRDGWEPSGQAADQTARRRSPGDAWGSSGDVGHAPRRRQSSRFETVRARYIRHVIDRAREIYQQPPEKWEGFARYERHLQYVGDGLVRGVPAALEADLAPLAEPTPPVELPAPPRLEDETRAEVERGSNFADAVRRFVLLRPDLRERGRDWLRVGLACARVLKQDVRTIRYLRELGRWHLRRNADEATRYLAEAARLAKAGRVAGERSQEETFLQQEGIALSYLGEALRSLSHPAEALEALERALEIHRRLNDRYMQAISLKHLGETHWRAGRLREAMACHQEAREIFEEMGLLSPGADMLNKIGSVHFKAGQQEEAIPYFREALKSHRQVGNRFMEVEDLNDLGISFKYLGRLEEAREHLEEAVEVAQQIGYGRMEAIGLANLASLSNEEEMFERSRELAERALERAREVRDRVPQSWALNWIGLAHQHGQRPGEAEKCFREALELSLKTRNVRGEAAFRANLGWLLTWNLGQPDEGVEHLRRAVRVLEKAELDQAYGGRRLEDIRELLAAAEDRTPPAVPPA